MQVQNCIIATLKKVNHAWNDYFNYNEQHMKINLTLIYKEKEENSTRFVTMLHWAYKRKSAKRKCGRLLLIILTPKRKAFLNKRAFWEIYSKQNLLIRGFTITSLESSLNQNSCTNSDHWFLVTLKLQVENW